LQEKHEILNKKEKDLLNKLEIFVENSKKKKNEEKKWFLD
jgi:hypothetical protein